MDYLNQKIEVKCSGSDMLPIDTIIEFQGKLKKLSDVNMNKLRASILKHGFIAPIFIWVSGWDNKILDGHQRIATLIKMRQEGYDIPLLPVVEIKADNEKDAKAKLLAISSQYGEFDVDFLSDWIKDLDEGIAETLRLVDEEIKFCNNSETQENNNESSESQFSKIVIEYSDEVMQLLDDYNILYKVKK